MAVIFGNDVLGVSSATLEGFIRGSVFTTGAFNYTVQKITAYWNPTGPPTYFVKCAIYNGNNLVPNSPTDEVSASSSAAWRDHGYAGTKPVLASNTAYALVAWTHTGAGTCIFNLDTGYTSGGRTQTIAYAASFPDPATLTTSNNKFSIYATLSVNYLLAGSAPVNIAVSSAMVYAPAGGAAHAITGSAPLALAVAATSLIHSRNYSLSGSTDLFLSPAAGLAYHPEQAIPGNVALTLSAAAGLDYTRNAIIAGAVPLSFLVESSTDYTRTITVAGTVLLSFLVSSTVQATSADVLYIPFVVSAENRAFTMGAESRIFPQPRENRIFTVQ